jgi:hypothetical protein
MYMCGCKIITGFDLKFRKEADAGWTQHTYICIYIHTHTCIYIYDIYIYVIYVYIYFICIYNIYTHIMYVLL